MDWKRLAKQFFGNSLLLLAGLIGISQLWQIISGKFFRILTGCSLAQGVWQVGGRALIFAVAAYLAVTGRRMNNPAAIPPSRFGWGKIVLGTVMLHSQIGSHFHWLPDGPMPLLKPDNAGEAAGMRFTSVLLSLLWIYLIYRGVRAGFPRRDAD